MKVTTQAPYQPHLRPAAGQPQPPKDEDPKDQVTLGLGERIGNGVIRGAKGLIPGAAGGAAGAVAGTAAFYTLTWGGRVGTGMALEFPQFIAAGGAIGGLVASAVEASAGDGTEASLTRAAITGGAVGAAVGVVAQMILWSGPM